jgi:hypothetical protein
LWDVIGDHWLLQIGVLIAAGVISAGIALAVIVRLPADYLSTLRPGALRKVPMGWVDVVVAVFRNLLGWALVGLGAVLTVPGIPGQGLLTIFAGVLLLDVPGKAWLLSRVFRQPHLLRAINTVRARWSRPPLSIP